MGFTQTINDITHVSDTRMHVSTIDHFLTSDINVYGQTGVIPHGASDQYIVYPMKKKRKIKDEKDEYSGRSYDKMNKMAFSYDVITTDWDDVYNEQDPKLASMKFKQIFTSLLDKHAPYKYFYSKRDRQPWVTSVMRNKT